MIWPPPDITISWSWVDCHPRTFSARLAHIPSGRASLHAWPAWSLSPSSLVRGAVPDLLVTPLLYLLQSSIWLEDMEVMEVWPRVRSAASCMCGLRSCLERDGRRAQGTQAHAPCPSRTLLSDCTSPASQCTFSVTVVVCTP